jgi:hypothetical protein
LFLIQVSIMDFSTEVSGFLHHTEHECGDTLGTRNCRLFALRSFFGFVAGREPTAVAQCTEILHIPNNTIAVDRIRPAPCPLRWHASRTGPPHTTPEFLRHQGIYCVALKKDRTESP